jgi:hypothetical protein
MCEPDSIDWEDIGQVLALGEEFAEAERERQRLLKELQPDEDDDSET